jgi:hypothetical protein
LCLTEFAGTRLCGSCRERSLAAAQAASPAGVVEHVIPTRNPPALAGYYCAIFSIIPCAGNLLGPAALVLGILGMKRRRENPNLPGKAHALVAIILGAVTTLFYWGLVVLLVIGALMSRQ